GESTLREAAEKHAVPFKTVESRARREGWSRSLHENMQVVQEIAGEHLQAARQSLGEQAAEFVKDSALQLKNLLADFRAMRGRAATLGDFESYVASFEKLVRTGRSLYALDQEPVGLTVSLNFRPQIEIASTEESPTIDVPSEVGSLA